MGCDVPLPALWTTLVMDPCTCWQMLHSKYSNDVWLGFIWTLWNIARLSVICRCRVSHLQHFNPTQTCVFWPRLSPSSFLIISLCLLQQKHYSFQSLTHRRLPSNPHCSLQKEGQAYISTRCWVSTRGEGVERQSHIIMVSQLSAVKGAGELGGVRDYGGGWGEGRGEINTPVNF